MANANWKAQLQEATEHIRKHDARLKKVIDRYGPCTIEIRSEYYHSLVRAIIGQQVSMKAAASIYSRFLELFGKDYPTPEDILATDTPLLRSAGLSGAKVKYIQDLALHIIDGRLEVNKLPELSNEEALAELTAVKGIGEWTAHMFLIFSLGRLDVLAVGDLGLRTGVKRLYNMQELPSPTGIRQLADEHHWHPYESIATWYVWRSLENE